MSQEQDNETKPLENGPLQNDSDSGVAVAPEKVRPATKRLPPYNVLLHNDDVNDMLFVVEKVVHLTPLSVEEAVERMLEAHHSGATLLLTTHKERAELYCEQFATFNLTATLELA